MSVHYKFRSALEYDTVTFDGLHISIADLKNAIMQQKRIGRGADFDLQVSNAQTREIYEDDSVLIPKNTSVLIARIPSTKTKTKPWEGYGSNAISEVKVEDISSIAKTADLSKLDVSEEDKIKAMMSQSTQDYDPSNYLKVRGSNQIGQVPVNYRCFKCHQGGHWIKDCPLSQGAEPMEIKKSTGIPRSFMVPVEGPQVPGAMMTPNGSFAVPVLDHQAYNEKPQPAAPVEVNQQAVPDDLVCSICSDLLTDTVMIPCCGNSFCDECIRSCLLESEDQECPDCHERGISPADLIPNRFLRSSVSNFKNTTGYTKRLNYLSQIPNYKPEQDKKIKTEVRDSSLVSMKFIIPLPVTLSTESEKLIISEADSTETNKLKGVAGVKSVVVPSSPINIIEGPPGVSPNKDESAKAQPITTMANVPRPLYPRHKIQNDRSPRRVHPTQKSPSCKESVGHTEDRPGTPTVDEPGNVDVAPPTVNEETVYQPPAQSYVAPMINVLPSVSVQPAVMGTYRPGPPVMGYQGPPPNFRMPPPIAATSLPYLPGPYNVPPRLMYEGEQNTAYQNFSNSYRPRGRDYPYRDNVRHARTPPGLIDDPLAAFEKMLKEKDERERRAKQRKNRSYSRSSSRSYSRSPVHRRRRSRSTRRRISRSRSRSFSMSRSRSRSFSPSPRDSPRRDYSPRGSPRYKRESSRYHSPMKSPTRGSPFDSYRGTYKRKNHDYDRDRDYHNRPPFRRPRRHSKDSEEYTYGGREFRIRVATHAQASVTDFYYDSYDRRKPMQDQALPQAAASSAVQWNQPLAETGMMRKDYSMSGYYAGPDVGTMHRYHSRDENPSHHVPPLMQTVVPQQASSIRTYEDIAPPGVEQPPIPGLENTPKLHDQFYLYDAKGVQDNNSKDDKPKEENCMNNKKRDEIVVEEEQKEERKQSNKSKEKDNSESKKEKRIKSSRSPNKTEDAESKFSKYKKRKQEESIDRDKRITHDKDKRRKDGLDEKKLRDKKKKKEEKRSEKKKRKEKKDKKDHDKEKTKKTDQSEKLFKETSSKLNEKEKSLEKTSPEIDIQCNKSLEQIKTEDKKTLKLETPENEVKVKEELKCEKLNDDDDKGIINTFKNEIEEVLDKADIVHSDLPVKKEQDEKINVTDFKKLLAEELKEEDDLEKDVLEIHTSESDLKPELELKSDVLAPFPEKSKWEVEDDSIILPTEGNWESTLEKIDKNAKVTNEVLKRAENAIFAKAINAIRPIEIKKISIDRAKLYSGEREASKDRKVEDNPGLSIQVTIPVNREPDVGTSVDSKLIQKSKSKLRLSVKERLGVKVDDIDRIVHVEKNKSKSLSPFSRRASNADRNLAHGERRVQRREFSKERQRRPRYRNERSYHRFDKPKRSHDSDRNRRIHSVRDRKQHRSPIKILAREHSKSRYRRVPFGYDPDNDKKAGKRRKDDRKDKHEKPRKRHKPEEVKTSKKEETERKEERRESAKPSLERRKSMVDEASFVPDYDLESESEKEDKEKMKEGRNKRGGSKSPESATLKYPRTEKRKDSSSDDSSSSSSEGDRKKRKHKKRKKRKSRKGSSSSSSSESDSESSAEDKDKKKKRHKKKQKRKKKSKK